MPLLEHCLIPDWPAPPNVLALSTTRLGGVSQGPYGSFNLGSRVGDDPAAVAENRRRLTQVLPAAPDWLLQVHGADVVEARPPAPEPLPELEADACFSRVAGRVCAIQTADCLPVLFCDQAGSVVAAAHAGWRGLAAGVLENTVAAMGVPRGSIIAWLGPAIGPHRFEVGDEVRTAFVDADDEAAVAFKANGPGKWLADIFVLACQRLTQAGLPAAAIYGSGLCTVSDSARFFSHRRDKVSGRQAALIWIDR
jgi:polyphenol oxidase